MYVCVCTESVMRYLLLLSYIRILAASLIGNIKVRFVCREEERERKRGYYTERENSSVIIEMMLSRSRVRDGVQQRSDIDRKRERERKTKFTLINMY